LLDTSIAEHIKTVALFYIRGRDVSFGKSLAGGTSTALLTMGTFSMYSVSFFEIDFWLIDRETNITLWHDERFQKGFTPLNPEFLNREIDDILLDLPEKIVQKK
jgi:hypothetical protein